MKVSCQHFIIVNGRNKMPEDLAFYIPNTMVAEVQFAKRKDILLIFYRWTD